MSFELAQYLSVELKKAYDKKGWSTTFDPIVFNSDDSMLEVKIFMSQRNFGIFSHAYQFFILDKTKKLYKIVIRGDYNTLADEYNAVLKSKLIFQLPIISDSFSSDDYTTAVVKFILADYSHLIKL
jgi:hypothetical protein